MAVRFREKEEDDFNDVNVTSLIDVLFVLLIVFMISASAVVHSSVKISLPQVHTKEKADTAEIEILVAKDGGVFIGNREFKTENLENYLRGLAMDKSTNKVIVKADGDTDYGQVMKVMDITRQAGLYSLTLAVEEKIGPK